MDSLRCAYCGKSFVVPKILPTHIKNISSKLFDKFVAIFTSIFESHLIEKALLKVMHYSLNNL